MAVHHPVEVIESKARIVAPPQLRRNRHARTFDLHPAVHLALAGIWLLFVGILSTAFMGPDLLIPTAINVIGVTALFLVPGLWARVTPDDGLPRQSFAEFLREGVETYTGPLATRDALAQIFTLPLLLLGLASAMVIIKLTI
jgi:hypothetical protein